MRLTSAVTTLVIAFAAGSAIAGIVPGDPAGGWFKTSCKDYKLSWRSKGGQGNGNGELVSLEASCRARDGSYKDNRLDLAICIGNFDGQMGWRRLGLFDDECGTCKIVDTEKDQYSMECTCKSVSHFRNPKSVINLNGRIRNEDGILWCGYLSSQYQPPA